MQDKTNALLFGGSEKKMKEKVKREGVLLTRNILKKSEIGKRKRNVIVIY